MFLLLLVGALTGVLPVQVVRVASASMSPTIGEGDLVVVDRSDGPVRRGDVVAARHPASGDLLVKRVVGLGGDEVAIEDGVLVVDGTAVCEPSIDPDRIDGVWFGPVSVPVGTVFLMGDERALSIDSRTFGAVPTGAVEGTVVARVWPGPGRLPEHAC